MMTSFIMEGQPQQQKKYIGLPWRTCDVNSVMVHADGTRLFVGRVHQVHGRYIDVDIRCLQQTDKIVQRAVRIKLKVK